MSAAYVVGAGPHEIRHSAATIWYASAMQQVRQGVNIARDLIAQFDRIARAMAQGAASQDDGDLSSQRAESERLYAGIWEHLDSAAATTRAAGHSADAYAAIRAGADRAVGVSGVTSAVTNIEHKAKHDVVTTTGTVTYNAQGIAAAKQAIAALQTAWPDIDWTPPAPEPEVDLRPRGFFARLFGR